MSKLLHSVKDHEQAEPIDIWHGPVLPEGYLIYTNRFIGERFWSFDPSRVMLMAMPQTPVKKSVDLYRRSKLPVLTFGHHDSFMANRSQIPEEFRPFKIYFLGGEFRKDSKLSTSYVFAIRYDGPKGWLSSEEDTTSSPPSDDTGQFLFLK